MKAYSTDLRERVIRAAKQGMPQAEIAKMFAISLSSIKRYLKQWRETATLEAKPIPGRPSKKLGPLQVDLSQMLAAGIVNLRKIVVIIEGKSGEVSLFSAVVFAKIIRKVGSQR